MQKPTKPPTEYHEDPLPPPRKFAKPEPPAKKVSTASASSDPNTLFEPRPRFSVKPKKAVTQTLFEPAITPFAKTYKAPLSLPELPVQSLEPSALPPWMLIKTSTHEGPAAFSEPKKPGTTMLKPPVHPNRHPFKLPPLKITTSILQTPEIHPTPMEVESPRLGHVGMVMNPMTLLGSDFKTATIKQRNIGDCYLLASFDAIQHHPAAAEILSQIEIIKKPGIEAGEVTRYIVNFPSGKSAEFTEDEIGMEKLGKKPLEGHQAWQILELAYSKATRSIRNRKRDSPFENDGEGHSPLILESGIAKNALYDMLGGEEEEVTCEDSLRTDIKNTDPFEANPNGLRNLVAFLRKVERDSTDHHYILAASSAAKSDTQDTIELVTQQKGKVTSQSFPRSHAYSIRSFSLDAPQTITLANPHDTASKVHTMSLTEFCKIFWRVSGIKLPAHSS